MTTRGQTTREPVLRPYSMSDLPLTPVENALKMVHEKQYGCFVWAVDEYSVKMAEVSSVQTGSKTLMGSDLHCWS